VINDTTKTEELVEICKEASLRFAIITAIEGLYLRSPIINHDPRKKGRGGGGVYHCNKNVKGCTHTRTIVKILYAYKSY